MILREIGERQRKIPQIFHRLAQAGWEKIWTDNTRLTIG